ncbi:MAG: hypothetical protein ACHQ4G_02390 [Opitutales bacterium]
MPRLSDNPDTRAIQIGLLGTLLVHLLLFLVIPHLLSLTSTNRILPRAHAPEQFNIELAPETFAPPKPKPTPFKFVETNPNAPENIPDKTSNFGARNQQVAQEKPTPNGHSDMPALEGQTEIKTTQIVSGHLTPVSPPAPPTPPQVAPTPPKTAKAPPREQIPLTGFEKKAGEDANNYGSNVAKFAEGAADVPRQVEGRKDVPLVENATSDTPKINPLRPQPRPSLDTMRARPAIFTENKFGTTNIGPTAVDSRWSNYGQYLQQLIETVQFQWERILIQSRVSPTSGTHVSVKFVLNKKGEVDKIVAVEATAGEQAQRACVSAISARAPYGEWTDDMVAMLGDSQEMTFTFYYQ